MRYPQMILFDYGHTLLYEPGWDSVRGNAELLKYVTKNPDHFTLDGVRKAAELIYGEHIEKIRKIGYDIGGQIGDKVLYEYLGMEFSLTPLEMEKIFWNGASMGAIMPEADIMLGKQILRVRRRSGYIPFGTIMRRIGSTKTALKNLYPNVNIYISTSGVK